jgi:hypothetical protein
MQVQVNAQGPQLPGVCSPRVPQLPYVPQPSEIKQSVPPPPAEHSHRWLLAAILGLLVLLAGLFASVLLKR